MPEIWTKCTYNPLYQKIETDSLSERQWEVFCADMASALRSVSRLDTKLSTATSELSQWFQSRTRASGTACGRRLAMSFDSLSPGLACRTAAWTLLIVLWQAWSHVGARGGIRKKYSDVVARIAPIGEIIISVQLQVNDGLESALINDRDAARAAFDATLRGLSECLDSVQEDENDATSVICSCGRPGHLQEQCTFKSRLI